jgi:cobaltochelatase CobN
LFFWGGYILRRFKKPWLSWVLLCAFLLSMNVFIPNQCWGLESDGWLSNDIILEQSADVSEADGVVDPKLSTGSSDGEITPGAGVVESSGELGEGAKVSEEKPAVLPAADGNIRDLSRTLSELLEQEEGPERSAAGVVNSDGSGALEPPLSLMALPEEELPEADQAPQAAPIVETVTDSDGVFTFADLGPGPRSVWLDVYSLPEEYRQDYPAGFSLQVDGKDAVTKTPSVTDGVYGLKLTAAFSGDNLTGSLFIDSNDDNSHDPGEKGISGVTVFCGPGLMTMSVQKRLNVLLVHSATSAKLMVDAVKELLKDPLIAENVNFIVRSKDQVGEIEEEELKGLIFDSDLVIMEWIFNPSLAKMLHVVENNQAELLTPEKQFLVIQSENPMMRFNRINGVDVFEGIPDSDLTEIVNVDKTTYPLGELAKWEEKYPQLHDWCTGRAYFDATGTVNYVNQLRWAINLWAQHNQEPDLQLAFDPPFPIPRQVIYYNSHIYVDLDTYLTSPEVNWQAGRPAVGIIEYNSPVLAGNTAHLDSLISFLEQEDLNVVPVAAKYGADVYEGMQRFFTVSDSVYAAVYGYEKVDLVISCGTFSLGAGGDTYEQTNQFLKDLGVPVLRAVTSTKRSPESWEISSDGLAWSDVYYQVALSELQGITEPVFIAGQSTYLDQETGAEVTAYRPVEERIQRLVKRARGWIDLQRTSNGAKKVALIYYNYPPGKQNIGASNLAVPDSLLGILQALKNAGYGVEGNLPEDPEAMVELLLKHGINIANWAPGLLEEKKDDFILWPVDRYQAWFEQQDSIIKKEVVEGPAGFIEEFFKRGMEYGTKEEVVAFLGQWQQEMESLLDGIENARGGRQLVQQMVDSLREAAAAPDNRGYQSSWERFLRAKKDFLALGLPGLCGWGPAPGNIMVVNSGGREYFAFPGMYFGNILIGPQPQRGWEADAGKFYHSLAVPPPHQYLAYYAFLDQEFGASAMVHVGRHGTYEWLPHKQALLTKWDYSDLAVSDIPSIYIYIVDGVGEGMQAKRRGLAVIIDHLTPPFEPTRLYGDLLEIKSLVENYEKLEGSSEDLQQQLQEQYLAELKEKIAALHLDGEIDTGLDGKDLVEAVHDYLVELETTLMPYGLHIFGQEWPLEKQVALAAAMLSLDGGNVAPSIQRLLARARGINFEKASAAEYELLNSLSRECVAQVAAGRSPSEVASGYAGDAAVRSELAELLETAQDYLDLIARSFSGEMNGLLNALDGRYTAPAGGGDPVRNPEALPTGRNFYALDPSTLPTKAAYELGKKLADEAWQRVVAEAASKGLAPPEKVAALVWCVETARDDGTMASFVMRLLGVKPKWDKNGAVKGKIELDSLSDLKRPRVDVIVTTSGLFRDIFGQVLVLMDRSFRGALAASYDTILNTRPDLQAPLDAAVQPLKDAKLFDSLKGNEPLDQNYVAKHWLESVAQLYEEFRRQGLSEEEASSRSGMLAMLRIFAPPVGDYGAGVSKAVEQAWTWENREELADLFLQRMGHAYSEQIWGENHKDLLQNLLVGVSDAFHSRSSNLYGVLNNDDCFDYFGGLSMAIEKANAGKAPNMYILDYANPARASVMTLSDYMQRELRTRYYNPEWVKGMMEFGYSGARNISNKFVSYLWGWQVTNPNLVQDWMWQEVKDVYLSDKYGLGTREWFGADNNAYALISITGTMLTAAEKGFWQADEATLKEIANIWAETMIQHGVACCDCSCGNVKMMKWATDFVNPSLLLKLHETLEQAIQQQLLTPEQIAKLTEPEPSQPTVSRSSSKKRKTEEQEQHPQASSSHRRRNRRT